MGDFNAHTGQSNGTTPHKHPDTIPHLQTNSQDIEPPKRKSLDHRKVDTYGHQLLQICDHRNLTILNGCTPGDSQGQFTYEMGNRCSVINYCIVFQSLWPHNRNFQIAGHNSTLSDHSLIVTEVNLYTTPVKDKQPHSTNSPLLKFDWSQEATQRLQTRFSSPNSNSKS